MKPHVPIFRCAISKKIVERQECGSSCKYYEACKASSLCSSREIIVDNFAGGGGASTGIEMATGRSVDIAINHDPEAIRMHKMNHPNTEHYCESVFDVDPVKACRGRRVALVWLSPDCKHFSKAKGGTPVEKEIRGLAWVTLRWAARVRPRVIMLENVEEFQTWGPLRAKRDPETGRVLVLDFAKKIDKNQQKRGRTRVAEPGEIVPFNLQVMEPDPRRKGTTFKKFVKALEKIGYTVEFRILRAADFGAPTMRKRLFIQARCDGRPIVWPEPTHGPINSEAVKAGLQQPYVGAYTQIDFSRPCPSIFDSSEEIKEKYGVRAIRPLADKTMERIARGLQKFVLDSQDPFIVQCNHGGDRKPQDINEPMPTITGKNGFGVVEPYMVQIGQTGFSDDRSKDVRDPLATIVTKNEHCLIAPTLIQYHSETMKSEVRGQDLEKPIMTLDGSNRYGLVSAFISKFRGTNTGDKIDNPLSTITAGGKHNAVCAAYIMQQQGQSVGTDITNPLNTITAGGMGHMHEVRAFLIKYYGDGVGQDINNPLDTVTTRDRFGLVKIEGIDYAIVDIGLRMLEPKELYGCQGFPSDYIIDRDHTGKSYPRSEQVKRCGNAVCPPIPAALVRANLPELCTGERMPNMGITEGEDGQLRLA